MVNCRLKGRPGVSVNDAERNTVFGSARRHRGAHPSLGPLAGLLGEQLLDSTRRTFSFVVPGGWPRRRIFWMALQGFRVPGAVGHFVGFEHVHAFVVHVGGGVDHVHASLQGGDERIAAGAWVQTRCGADVRHLGNPELFGDVGVGRCLGARDFLAGDAGLDLVDGTFVTWMPTPAAIDQRAQLVEDKQGSGYSGDSGSAESRDIHRLGRWEVRPPMRWPWTSPVRSSSTRPCPMTRIGSGEILGSLFSHGKILLVVDQPATIGNE